MILRKRDIVELRIDRIAYGGKGVARMDGLVVFVKDTVPGDRVLGRITKKKKGYAEANLVELLIPSPDRILPQCPYSMYCGGCQWQHLEYGRQLEYKREHLREAMARIGTISDVTVHDTIPCENRFRYRNKMEFSFSDRRWLMPEEFSKIGTDTGFGLGLHIPGTFCKVIDIEACLLQSEMGDQILHLVREYVRASNVPVYGLKSHEGFWRFLTLRYSAAFNEWMVNLVTSEERGDLTGPLAELLCRRFENIRTVVNNINSRKAAIAFGEKEVVLAGDGYIQDRIGKFCFQISANSFFQTNTSGALRLYDKVVEYAGLKGSETVLDLYCGTGTIPIFLSEKAKEVMGMEIVESAVLDAKKNCRENKINNCRFLLGDIRNNISGLQLRPDVLVVDPPRAGMHKDVLSSVLELAADRIVYVSCNPATMARDMKELIKQYGITDIQPVDMFPHTFHIEAVARLVRRTNS